MNYLIWFGAANSTAEEEEYYTSRILIIPCVKPKNWRFERGSLETKRDLIAPW